MTSRVHLTLWNSVLLQQLYNAGIKGKFWKLMKKWYSGISSQVKLMTNSLLFFLLKGRGIRQDSVLSPTLFNLVIDPLLSKFKDENRGLSINGLFLGAFGHANNICIILTNSSDKKDQFNSVNTYVNSIQCWKVLEINEEMVQWNQ